MTGIGEPTGVLAYSPLGKINFFLENVSQL